MAREVFTRGGERAEKRKRNPLKSVGEKKARE